MKLKKGLKVRLSEPENIKEVAYQQLHHYTNTQLQLVLVYTWPPYTKGKMMVTQTLIFNCLAPN